MVKVICSAEELGCSKTSSTFFTAGLRTGTSTWKRVCAQALPSRAKAITWGNFILPALVKISSRRRAAEDPGDEAGDVAGVVNPAVMRADERQADFAQRSAHPIEPFIAARVAESLFEIQVAA